MATFISDFEQDLAEVLKKHQMDKLTKTEDYILAAYITTCIAELKSARVAQVAHDKS